MQVKGESKYFKEMEASHFMEARSFLRSHKSFLCSHENKLQSACILMHLKITIYYAVIKDFTSLKIWSVFKTNIKWFSFSNSTGPSDAV